VTAPSWRTGPLAAIAASALAVGLVATWHYAGADLTLSHYDARGHLVVSRRIIDSITPGWQQIGAVWLPLPHLLNLLPTQVDALYRTGAFAVAVSVASFAVASAAIAWLIAALTGSWLAAAAGTTVFAVNPNVLYLQATPMTEPLLIALTLSAVALLIVWCGDHHDDRSRRPSTHLVGWAFALACLTRYEAWPVTIAALAVAVAAMRQRGCTWREAVGEVGAIAVYPLGAIGLFSVFSRIVVGSWFASGFFVPENPAQGHPYEALEQIVWGLRELSGVGVLAAAGIGATVLLVRALRNGARVSDLLPLTLLGMAAVSWVAFFDGHPYRIRYMVPLVAAQAVLAGVAAGTWRRARLLAIATLVAIVAVELRPLDGTAAMVLEAQWDRPNATARTRVTVCLREAYAGDTVMASMGSLGHYMQDLSRAGFSVRDFLHEGNGDIWLNALHSPRPFAGWILIEEKAEGGDMLAAIVRERPSFLDGYTRVCEGAGVVLYRRQ
jgi:hypothetical protein